MTASRLISLLATALVVGIVGQTLFFKFTAAPESVALFTQLGLEPFGRVGIGVAELVALATAIPIERPGSEEECVCASGS